MLAASRLGRKCGFHPLPLPAHTEDRSVSFLLASQEERHRRDSRTLRKRERERVLILRPQQLAENLGALELRLPAEIARRLEEASRPELVHPYHFFQDFFAGMASGETLVRAEPPWFRG
jgi:hypothetical protein